MKRIRIIAMAAVAAMALSAALGASGASASELAVQGQWYPAPIKGNSDGGSTFRLQSGEWRCTSPLLSATMEGGAKTISMAGSDSSCGAGRTFKPGSCRLVFNPGHESYWDGHHTASTEGTFEVGPSNCGSMVVAETGVCSVSIPAQSGIAASFYNNPRAGGKKAYVSAFIETEHLKYTQTGSGCTNGTWTNGNWFAGWDLTALPEPTLPADLIVREKMPVSIGGTPPKLLTDTMNPEWQVYNPAYLVGQQSETNKHVLNLTKSGKVECSSIVFRSTEEFEPSSQFTVTPTYGNCAVLGFPGTVNMNGCVYNYKVLNEAPVGGKYAGHADISCPVGKSIEIIANPSAPRCTITIGSQTTNSGGLTFTNQPGSEEAPPYLGLTLNMSGIRYHSQAGTGVGKCSTLEDASGTYTGESTLLGYYYPLF